MISKSISRAITIAASVAAMAVSAPAAATTFVWQQGGDFDDGVSQDVTPTFASQLRFFGGDYTEAYAHSHGQDVNFTITATIDGTLQTIYSQLLAQGAEQSIPALGTINFAPGTVSGIGFGCDVCSFNTFHSFGYNGETSFSLTAGVPEPASWAMLIVGFGLVGAAARRRSLATAA